jgi:hypothetical protein
MKSRRRTSDEAMTELRSPRTPTEVTRSRGPQGGFICWTSSRTVSAFGRQMESNRRAAYPEALEQRVKSLLDRIVWVLGNGRLSSPLRGAVAIERIEPVDMEPSALFTASPVDEDELLAAKASRRPKDSTPCQTSTGMTRRTTPTSPRCSTKTQPTRPELGISDRTGKDRTDCSGERRRSCGMSSAHGLLHERGDLRLCGRG